MLTLYPVIFLNSLFVTGFQWVGTFRFSRYVILSYTNNNNFTFFFLVFVSPVSFSCVMAWVRISRIILHNSSKIEILVVLILLRMKFVKNEIDV